MARDKLTRRHRTSVISEAREAFCERSRRGGTFLLVRQSLHEASLYRHMASETDNIANFLRFSSNI